MIKKENFKKNNISYKAVQQNTKLREYHLCGCGGLLNQDGTECQQGHKQ